MPLSASICHVRLLRTLLAPERGDAVLQVIEDRLVAGRLMADDPVTLADISFYGYTRTAEKRGGLDRAPPPDTGCWLDRVAALPGYVGKDV